MGVNCSLGPPECETKLSLKLFWYEICKMHGFHGNILYDSREWGGIDLKIRALNLVSN